LGAKIPKGIMLIGPRGSGKSLLAEAAAGETNLLLISNPQWKFQHDGASAISDLFEAAKMKAPCILYINEIDAAKDYILHQLLIELDNLDTTNNEKHIAIVADANADSLDKSLFESGRFGRKIFISHPDIKERLEILNVHLKGLKTTQDKKELSKKMATMTAGCSGADIAKIANDAALIAARDHFAVEMEHFEQAHNRLTIFGTEQKNKAWSQEEKKMIAYHEAGHVIAGWFLEHASPVWKASIIPRGQALGYTQYLAKDNNIHTKRQIFDEICVALAGRVAEEIFFDEVTSSAVNDLEQVTALAYGQVAVLGMNEKIGCIRFDAQTPFGMLHSESTAGLIDKEVRKLVNEALETTRNLLTTHKAQLEKVAEQLLEKETLSKDDIVGLIGSRPFKDNLNYEELAGGTFPELKKLASSKEKDS
jgi:AFG3 family protein